MIDHLIYCINSYRDAAMSKDSKFDHIDIAEKQKVQFFFFNIQEFHLLVHEQSRACPISERMSSICYHKMPNLD